MLGVGGVGRVSGVMASQGVAGTDETVCERKDRQDTGALLTVQTKWPAGGQPARAEVEQGL